MSKTIRVLVAGAMLATLAGVAAAQDRNATPSYGALNLAAGFSPDPAVVVVDAGGGGLAAPCDGVVHAAPDVRLTYSGGSAPLIVSVDSATDTTLLVSGPDGAWYCDDDGGEAGGNPSLLFERAESGDYHIWVGGGAASAPAELTLSETISR